ncbi:MAG: type II toxin-antitoxin system VapC family toxin [bacterium]|nr:type II toxin-antitoxin system VapC family toxin [bacterium]
MRVYLDNCCFNRPFDEQSQPKIRLETEAKLFIQEALLQKKLELAWSYMLDFENAANPFDERKNAIEVWRHRAAVDVEETSEVLERAEALRTKGLSSKDALHVACAIASRCEYFVTTDASILRKLRDFLDVKVLDPTALVRRIPL